MEYYVPLCKEKIIPIKEWEECTVLQLYYIKNGIYAYGGMVFESDFYDVFEWYDGHIPQNEFKKEFLNETQHNNIANILKISSIKKKKNH